VADRSIMAVAIQDTPTILLLGGGYTLQRVAERLAPGSFVITSRDSQQCQRWRQLGWIASQVVISDASTIEQLFLQYPNLKTVIDSVPPLRSASEDLSEATLGVRNMAKSLLESSVERVVYLSTTGVFGVRDGSWVNEATPAAPWNSQGAARLACEDVYRQLVAQVAARVVARVVAPGVIPVSEGRARIDFTALRLPAIYGPDRGVAISLRAGTYSLVGDGSQWTNRIHVDDLADIIIRCIGYLGILPPVLCINDDFPTTARDVVSYLCKREGLAMPPSVSTEEVLRRGAYTMLSNQRVENYLMKSVLGVVLRYPSFREGTLR
jgi:nucleoside-diphosphate-sugar epimerase